MRHELAAVVVGALTQVRLQREDYITASVTGAFAAFMALIGAGLIHSRSFSNPKRIAPIIRDAGYCACCGRPWADLPPDVDGFRVCPGCGSAWRCGPPA